MPDGNPESAELRVGGIVLCGGRSSRMGRDKAWVEFGGQPMLRRVTDVLARATRPVVVVAAAGQALPELGSRVEVAVDRAPDRGPVEGLCVGLEALAGRCDAVFVTGCDYPFLDPELPWWLAARLGDHELIAARVDGHVQTLAAVYRVTVLESARRLLERGLGLRGLMEWCRYRVLEEADLVTAPGGLGNFTNFNTPSEYDAARLRAEG